MTDRTVEATDRTVEATDKTTEVTGIASFIYFKYFFSNYYENVVEVYVNVNDILMVIVKGGIGCEDDTRGGKRISRFNTHHSLL
ncbi:hypothetical protein ACMGD3_17415 [Lysinibacillus sphaericus]|uniref:hypothetical protein n=1 Tax=Lysinibacillus sphaericus TaxID=1421 RepID=UPI003F7A5776